MANSVYYSCIFCKKSKPASSFSDRQQTVDGKRCISCTHNPREVSLFCRVCGKNYTSDKFSYTQRRQGSKRAVCRKCMDVYMYDIDSSPDDDDG